MALIAELAALESRLKRSFVSLTRYEPMRAGWTDDRPEENRPSQSLPVRIAERLPQLRRGPTVRGLPQGGGSLRSLRPGPDTRGLRRRSGCVHPVDRRDGLLRRLVVHGVGFAVARLAGTGDLAAPERANDSRGASALQGHDDRPSVL